MDQGIELLQKKDFPGAEQVFTALLELEEDVSARNNLAMAIFLCGDAARVLAVLEPNLDLAQPRGNPFSFALAAQVLAALGRREEGRRHLDVAAALFERGKAYLEEMGIDRKSWHEYTITIMKGAAALEEHRLVFELYRRWERYHVSWENRYLAGIASFNLGRYGRAASLWGSLAQVGRFAMHMQQVAFLVERGLIPPFFLGYESLDSKDLKRMAQEAVREQSDAALARYAGSSAVRMALLSYLFSPEIAEKEIKGIMLPLILYGGEWGEAFGRRLLEAGGVPREFKLCAAFALVQRGIFKPGEPIPVIIDGMEQTITFTQKEVSLEPDPELDKLDQQARDLRKRGLYEDAVILLEPLFEQGRFYPPAMLTLATLYRDLKRHDQARKVLETMEEMLPGHRAGSGSS